jgi:hypothetical protein
LRYPDNSEQHDEAAENTAHDEQYEPDFGDPYPRAVGVEGALGVLLARGGRPLEADAAVVDFSTSVQPAWASSAR